MSRARSVIELNGKHYDAHSGEQIVATAKTHVVEPTVGKGTNMDGFVRASQKSTIVTPTSPAHRKARKHTVQHAKRAPQGTKTLMRHVVKKPKVIADTAPAAVAPALTPHIQHPHVAQQLRSKQAKTITKSPLISRFGTPTPRPAVTQKTKPLPVVPAPASLAHHKPSHAAASHHAKKHATPSASHDHIARAMEKSTSHQNKRLAKPKRRQKVAHKLGVSPRFVSTAAASLSILLLVGFFAYQNVPSIAVRLASSKAGFSAKLPGYSPSGFAMDGPVQAGPGVITMNFASNSDDRAFQLSQRPSAWNSESLANNYLAPKSQAYQTFQEAGKTIYMYDDSNATWVSGGIWYVVEGNSSLSSDQLLRIASSL